MHAGYRGQHRRRVQRIHRLCKQQLQFAFLYRCLDDETQIGRGQYCAEKGLLDRVFYNSLTVWEKDLETEIKEIYQIGIKHVLLVAFDQADQMPSGRITGTQKLLDAIEKAGARFESIFVDTSVMNGPATALCGLANKLIKEKWGFPTASAPSNGSYMWKKARELWGFKGWSAADAALEGLAAFFIMIWFFQAPWPGPSGSFRRWPWPMPFWPRRFTPRPSSFRRILTILCTSCFLISSNS